MSILSLPNSTINGSLADKINSTVATSSWPSSKLWQLTTLNLKSVIIALIDLFILNLKNRLNCELDETFLLALAGSQRRGLYIAAAARSSVPFNIQTVLKS